MRQSKLFFKTQKSLSDEYQNISTCLLIKGDFIEPLLSGVYSFLPLGACVRKKMVSLVAQEMFKIGGQDLMMPALQSKDLWEASGRWNTMNPPLFKFKDQHKKELLLAPTHEEVISVLASKRIFSYKDLPLALFQIQTKFRNEARPTGGLLRTREFLMKDLYSFHKDEKDLENYYEKVCRAYENIFQKLNLKVLKVRASSGSIGGDLSHEFMVFASVGEDKIYICQKCGVGFSVEYLIEQQKNKNSQNYLCEKCKGKLIQGTAIECGHTFNLGTRYSEKIGVYFTDKDGKKKPVVMGCYGIGIDRLIATVVEIHHDASGIIWPSAIAPFDVHLINLSPQKEKVVKKAEELYQSLKNKRLEILYDDRDNVSAGEKLVEADLIGLPMRVIISEKTIANEAVEIKERQAKDEKLTRIEEFLAMFNNQ